MLPTGCLEAAASGTPLIVSVETNLGTYLNKFKSGFVYLSDGRPVQALADKLVEAERLFEQKDDYLEMCKNANRMICEELNWDNIADMDMKELYNIKNDASLFAYTLQLGSLAGGQERTGDR